MKTTPKKKKFSVFPVLRVFWTRARNYPFTLTLMLLGTVTHVSVEIIAPLYYKRLFDAIATTVTPSNEEATVLLQILGSIALLQGAAWIGRRFSQISNIRFQTRMMKELTEDAFRYTLGHSYGFFTNNFTGSLVRKMTRLARSFEVLVDQMMWEFIPLTISMTGIMIVLFSRNTTLGFVFLTWSITLMSLQLFVANWKVRYNLATAAKDSESTGILSDAMTNDITIKLFTGKSHEESLFAKVSEELRRARITSWGFDEVINMTQAIFTIAIEIGLLYVTIRLWEKGLVTVGDFALIQSYVLNAIHRLWNFGNVMRRSYEAFADATEMVDVMNTPHEVRDKPTAKPLEVTEGKVEFRKTGFSYRMTHDVLNDFSLTIAPKEKIALVGPSGAGKSTVVKLLFRFFDVTKNGIFIDDQNIADVTQESLRGQIALVPQEPILFHRTLMENIRYGKRDATDEEVIDAAKKAHCYEFISRYPEGFNTYVGERGVKLSGGERQRVAIARAILKNAPILVLDEATSSLDSESEAFIQDALGKLMEGKTVIVIAHRLSTIMKMDRIVVMKDGKVATSGTHTDLLKDEDGLYKKLWDIQAGGFLVEEEQ